MASLRAALLWAIFTLTSSHMAWAQIHPRIGPAVPMEYCATVNTANTDPLENSIYQSDGRCSGNCTDRSYAFAIVQDHNCWCSNLIPNIADRKSISECQLGCPGYPSDWCGGDGTFGYMAVVGISPTGTAPAGFGFPTTSLDSSSSTVQPTVPVSLSGSSSSTSTSITSTPPPPPPTPTVQTVTIGGTVKTVTVTPDPTGTADPALAQQTAHTGLQAGAIVGIVIGVVGGLAVIAAFLWLWFSRRRRQNDLDENGPGTPVRAGSSPGTLGTPRTGETSEYAAAGAAAAGWDASTKRRSYLMPVDPRLDPYAKGIYDQNRSRESFSSLQDNQDYSRRVHDPPRVLRATNPDPDGE